MDQPYRPHGGEPDPRPYSPSDPARGYAQDGAAAGGGAAGAGPWAGGGDAAPSPWARGAGPGPSYPQPGSSYPESGPSYSQPGSSYPESGPSYAQPGPYEPGYQPGYQPAGTDPGYQPTSPGYQSTSPGYPQYQPAGTDQGYPSYQPAGADPAFSSMAPGTPVMLGGPITPERPKRRRRGVLVAAGTAVALLIGGVAYAGISLWSSPGGTEPEDVMPGGVAAFGRLDLDPALGQQKKIADLLGKFPNRGGSAEERVALNEARLSEAQRTAHVGSFEWDIGSNRVAWTDELHRIYGLEPGL